MKGIALRADEAIEVLTFEDFFSEHYADLARMLYLLTGDAAEADDLAQEAMARVLERWERVRRMESPGGYLYRVAVNLNRKRLRRWWATTTRPVAGLRAAPDPEQVAERHSDVLQALSMLSPGQRKVLVLVEALGMEIDEAAAICGIEPVSVRVRLHRAKNRIRKQLGDGDD